MTKPTIRSAHKGDAADILWMLQSLADDLGPAGHCASTVEGLEEQGFGARPVFQCLIAEAGGQAVGMALYFSHFSTYRGGAGAYVQDLWVAPDHRGSALGQRLLAEVAKDSKAMWDAGYLALAVDHQNTGAARFYARLGFDTLSGDRPQVLERAGFELLLSDLNEQEPE
jgi:ribosomal protein S18 acetylase RimI-like enzyme